MRSKIILFLALVMGVVTTVLFFNYMKQFDTETVVNENVTTVVVAKEKIEKNEQITEAKLEKVEVPSKGLHDLTIKSMDGLTGQYATADIEKGEILLSHRLKSEKDEAIFVSKKVQKGFRAVSIGVNFVQSTSNLIEPEDYVDVIFSEIVKVGQEEEVRTEMLLSNVRVLAVDRRLIETQSEVEEFKEYSAVTLELSPQNTIKLVDASVKGTLHLAIHTRIIGEVQKDSTE